MPAETGCQFPLVLLLLLGLFSAPSAGAHSQSSARLVLDLSASQTKTMTVEIALIDLSQVLDLDRDSDGSVTWGEITSADASIVDFVTTGVQVLGGGTPCRLKGGSRDFSLVGRSDIPHLSIQLAVLCPATAGSAALGVHYGLFFDVNPAHRALLRVIEPPGDSVYLLSPGDSQVRLARDRSPWSAALAFGGEGIRHILSGYDHLVFLALLILPAASGGAMRQKLLRIGLIITSFTAAHSVTLAAATMGLINLPARPVEIGIAASIVVAAAINIIRPSNRLSWQVAFAFGLLHGFGFAGALQEMSVGGDSLLVALLAFNVGVELGQLAVVALILPVLALLSTSARYRSVVVPAVSVAGAAVGVIWTAARL